MNVQVLPSGELYEVRVPATGVTNGPMELGPAVDAAIGFAKYDARLGRASLIEVLDAAGAVGFSWTYAPQVEDPGENVGPCCASCDGKGGTFCASCGQRLDVCPHCGGSGVMADSTLDAQ